MTNKYLSCLIVFITVIIPVVQPIAVEWDGNFAFWDNAVRHGGETNLRCLGTDMDELESVSIEKIIVTDSGPVSVVIATNIEVLTPYSTLLTSAGQSRYSVDHEIFLEDNEHILTLTITGAFGDDGGTYRCTTDGGQETSQDKTLIVQEPITAVHAIFIDDAGVEIQDASAVTWRANTMESVGCDAFVDGSVDVPNIEIIIGGEDVTDRFHTIYDIDVAQEVAGTPGLYHLTMLRKQSSNTVPDPYYNGEEMICRGYTNGFEDTVLTASLQLTVETIPKVTCESDRYAPVLGMPLEMKCTVKSNPRSSTITFTSFTSGNTDSEISNVITETTSIAGTDILWEESGDVTNITLTVGIVDESTLEQTFRLEAENMYGSHMATVDMTGDGTPTGTGHTISACRASLFLMVFFVLAFTSVNS